MTDDPGAFPTAPTPAPRPTPDTTAATQPDPSIGGQAAPAPAAGLDHRGHIRGTRISAVWTGIIAAALLLVALLVFIVQNSRTVEIHFLGFHGHLSLAVALLLSAVLGVLLVAIPGTGRIIQLRRALKANQRR